MKLSITVGAFRNGQQGKVAADDCNWPEVSGVLILWDSEIVL